MRSNSEPPIHAIAEVTFLPKEQGGRATPPSSGYRGHIHYDGDDWGAQWTFAWDPVEPGQTVEAMLQFLSPRHHALHLTVGKDFSIREGPHTIGSGRVTWLDVAGMSASDR